MAAAVSYQDCVMGYIDLSNGAWNLVLAAWPLCCSQAGTAVCLALQTLPVPARAFFCCQSDSAQLPGSLGVPRGCMLGLTCRPGASCGGAGVDRPRVQEAPA